MILAWAVICLYVLGSIGGFGYALYCRAWLIAVGVVVLAVLAFPTVKRLFSEAQS